MCLWGEGGRQLVSGVFPEVGTFNRTFLRGLKRQLIPTDISRERLCLEIPLSGLFFWG